MKTLYKTEVLVPCELLLTLKKENELKHLENVSLL